MKLLINKVFRPLLEVFESSNSDRVPIQFDSSNVDAKLIKKLKKKYRHDNRITYFNENAYNVDSIYCHAVPGTIETVILLLNSYLKKSKSKNLKLLNLGGGVGQVADIYTAIGYKVTNVDIEVKKETSSNIKFDLNSTSRLPIKRSSYDVIVCQEIIEHLNNPWQLIESAHTLLKPNGHLVLTTPNIASKKSKDIFVKTNYFHWFTEECFEYHINPIPYWEVELILEKVGFTKSRILGSGEYYFKKSKNISELISFNEGLIFITKK